MDDGLESASGASSSTSERSGQVQLPMTAIDPEYTLGRLADERDRVLTALRAEGLLERNAGGSARRPAAARRPGHQRPSAACTDFLHELEASGFGLVGPAARRPGAGPRRRAADRRRARRAVAAGARRRRPRPGRRGPHRPGRVRRRGHRPGHRRPSPPGVHRDRPRDRPERGRRGGPHRLKTPTACAAWLVARVRAFCERLDRCWDGVGRASQSGLARQDELAIGRAGPAGRAAGPRSHLPGRPAPSTATAIRVARAAGRPRSLRRTPGPVRRPAPRARPGPGPRPGLVHHPTPRRHASSGRPTRSPTAPSWSPRWRTARSPAG